MQKKIVLIFILVTAFSLTGCNGSKSTVSTVSTALVSTIESTVKVSQETESKTTQGTTASSSTLEPVKIRWQDFNELVEIKNGVEHTHKIKLDVIEEALPAYLTYLYKNSAPCLIDDPKKSEISIVYSFALRATLEGYLDRLNYIFNKIDTGENLTFIDRERNEITVSEENYPITVSVFLKEIQDVYAVISKAYDWGVPYLEDTKEVKVKLYNDWFDYVYDTNRKQVFIFKQSSEGINLQLIPTDAKSKFFYKDPTNYRIGDDSINILVDKYLKETGGTNKLETLRTPEVIKANEDSKNYRNSLKVCESMIADFGTYQGTPYSISTDARK